MGRSNSVKRFGAVLVAGPLNSPIEPPDPTAAVRNNLHIDPRKERRAKELIRKNGVLDARREQREAESAKVEQRALEDQLEKLEAEKLVADGALATKVRRKSVTGGREEVKAVGREIKEERKKLAMVEEILVGVEDDRSQLLANLHAHGECCEFDATFHPTGAPSSPALKKVYDNLAEIAAKLDKFTTRRSEREREGSSLDNAIERARARREALGQMCNALERERIEARAEKDKVAAAEVARLIDKPFDLLEDEIEAAQAGVDDVRRQTTKLKPLQGEVPNIQKRITHTRQERDKLEKTCERVADEIVRSERELDEKATILKDLRHETAAKTCGNSQIQEAEYKLAERQTQHAALVAKRAKLQRDLAAQGKDAVHVRHAVPDASHTSHSIELEVQSARDKIASLRAQMNAAGSRADANLQARLTDVRSMHSAQFSSIQRLNVLVREAKTRRAELQAVRGFLEYQLTDEAKPAMKIKLGEVNFNIVTLKSQILEARLRPAAASLDKSAIAGKVRVARREVEVERKRAEMLEAQISQRREGTPNCSARDLSEAEDERTRWEEQHRALQQRVEELRAAAPPTGEPNSRASLFRARLTASTDSGTQAPTRTSTAATSDADDPRGQAQKEKLASVIIQLNKAIEGINNQLNQLRTSNAEITLQLVGCR